MNSIKNELFSAMFKRERWHLNRCLAPGMACTSSAIRAHSVQNSRMLDLLVHNGHVKAIAKRITKERGPELFFDDVGRNQATTFTGFCPDHDSQIFNLTDAKPFAEEDAEYKFLIAYTSCKRSSGEIWQTKTSICIFFERGRERSLRCPH